MADEQIVEPVIEGSQQEQAVDPVIETPAYTEAELAEFTPTSEIDLERVPAAFRPVIENMTRDYKELQKGFSKVSQEAAELKKAIPVEPERYFDDSRKDSVFKDYLKSPLKVVGEINAEIANLEAVIPDDGYDEYKQARKMIAYWNGIKDEFQIRKIEVSEHSRTAEIAEAKLAAELGESKDALLDYAKSQGFSERDFKARPEIRALIKKAYAVENAGKTAPKKEIKPTPQHAAKPSGESGRALNAPVDESKLSDDEWFKLETQRKAERYKTRHGG